MTGPSRPAHRLSDHGLISGAPSVSSRAADKAFISVCASPRLPRSGPAAARRQDYPAVCCGLLGGCKGGVQLGGLGAGLRLLLGQLGCALNQGLVRQVSRPNSVYNSPAAPSTITPTPRIYPTGRPADSGSASPSSPISVPGPACRACICRPCPMITARPAGSASAQP